MVEAERKKHTNIIEYIIYMYHSEDVVRSCQFSIDIIRERIINPKAENKSERAELLKWYMDLVEEMEADNLQDRGHVSAVLECFGELSYLHKTLMNVLQDKDYLALWEKAYPNLLELEKKTNGASRNPVELAVNGLYGVVIYKMQGKTPLKSTLEAVESFSTWLNYLGKVYRDVKSGKFTLPKTMNN